MSIIGYFCLGYLMKIVIKIEQNSAIFFLLLIEI